MYIQLKTCTINTKYIMVLEDILGTPHPEMPKTKIHMFNGIFIDVMETREEINQMINKVLN